MTPLFKGKVREIYDVSDKHLVIVTTDRISAFDNILPIQIKNKGVVLNKISNFWFDKTKNIISNHIIETDVNNMPSFFHDDFYRDRTVMVKKLNMIPIEFVVRGYIFGSMWEAYKSGDSFSGNMLSDNYLQAQKLNWPILTPAMKNNIGHDEYVDIKTVEECLGCELTKRIVEVCFELYENCSKYALERGLIIADTKFEFGLDSNGSLILADEIFTPDSSRYWDVSDYAVGSSPKSFDKQLLRDWLLDNRVDGEFQFDNIPKSIIYDTEKIYNECLNRLVH